ncbi:MAG: nucleoside hydrolase [Candidatus Hinthialibacter antarcticus]|nr:nucleoside hydrolase [Candidatus Hinthialibacter antarcticus]
MFNKISILLLISCFALLLPAQAQRIPVILDTDIGDDIDDTWALGMILASPELDLKLVVTDFGDTTGKAKIAAKFLESVGRGDIPIGVGVKTSDKAGRQIAWAEDYDLAAYPGGVIQDGIGAIIDTVASTTDTVTMIVIGPCPNIPKLLQRAPAIVNHVRVVAMSGSIDRGYEGSYAPDAEYNVRADIAAAQALYRAGWDLTITPLDTCGAVRLRGIGYQDMLRMANSTPRNQLVNTIQEAYQAWAKAGNARLDTQVASSVLYDTVAVYLAFDQSKCEIEDLKLKVDHRGYTVRDPNGKTIHTAMRWAVPLNEPDEGFHQMLFDRYMSNIFIPPDEEYDPFAVLKEEIKRK